MSIFSKILGDPAVKNIKRYLETVGAINGLEPEIRRLSDEQLKASALELKNGFIGGVLPQESLVKAFALVREASARTLGQRPYDAQLVGGLVLNEGKIAEMKTGEGKTLAAVAPGFLNGLAGRGVHIVTVNDYLAKRDAVWMGQIYDALGMSVGCITNEISYLYDPSYGMDKARDSKQEDASRDEGRDKAGGFRVEESYLRPCSRKDAYAADITYGTNNEFAFDYLRDNMAMDNSEMVQRGFYFAIVDEIDSILIDEARTPLIISRPDLESSSHYREFSRIVPQLKPEVHYQVDEKMKSAFLTDEGVAMVEKILGLKNIYEEKGIRYLHYLEQALRAHTLFQKDRDYLVKNNEVLIIDEFTGRILPGRRYSGGLHQALEAKENVEVKPESLILATITFQNYFRMYQKLSGMTGTAATSAEEFDKVYKLDVVAVPTNKPVIRRDFPDLIYKSEAAKFKAVVREIKERHKEGQPVLAGTRSVEKNEYLSRLLEREGIKHEVLNAKNHSREGQIIAQAGRLAAVTVATNMAGRGVDIVLGGNPLQAREAEKVKALGGLHIVGTERHEARRIDNQLRGRGGRQGDEGSSRFFVSLEDELMRIFGGDKIKKLMEMLKMPEDEPIEAKVISRAIEKAQSKVEGLNFDSRSHILEYDDVMAKHRQKIYAQRKDILNGDYEALKATVAKILREEIAKIVFVYSEDAPDPGGIAEEIKTVMPLSDDALTELGNLKNSDDLAAYLYRYCENLLQLREQNEGTENLARVYRFACLKCLDLLWTEHLVNMDHLKDSVALRAYGGKDPLVEYKTEGHKLFQALWAGINSQIARTVFKLSLTKQ
ncbi:MAG: preprotein translocase subunit SecA [Candidatus Pacebacteria bacterium]|nr:preprotein translocase subunit SecA [Candidatus Paceibacterota bacterium]